MTHPKLATAQSGFGGRGYRIPGRTDAWGKQRVYPSVTTVLKQVAKPGLMQWIADQTAAYAVANITKLLSYADEKMWGYLRFYWNREPDLSIARELRTHSDGVRDDAGELGTNFHEIVEADLQGQKPPLPNAPEVWEMVGAFEEWITDHEITVHRAEFTVVNDDLEYAGTGDADWSIRCIHLGVPCVPGADRFGGVRCLVDLKTSRYTWPEHGMQLAALLNAEVRMIEVPAGTPGAARAGKGRDATWWLEEPNPNYERAVLLHVRPRDLSPSGERIEAFCELVDMTEDLDIYMAGFEGALALCQSARLLKSRGDKRALAGL